MILIDDAGSGSLIGGTCIGIYRIETGEYKYSIIPVELYKNDNYEKKSYLNYVIFIVSEFFYQLNVSLEEEIYVCRGYIFDELRKWLKKNGFIWYNAKIGEPLQSLIESSFEKYTMRLGLPSNFIKYTRYPFHFHQLLKWVYADYKNRSTLCKTGWKSWKKYGYLPYEITYKQLKKSNFYCLFCGEKIKDDSTVKTITYFTKSKQEIYLHQRCNSQYKVENLYKKNLSFLNDY